MNSDGPDFQWSEIHIFQTHSELLGHFHWLKLVTRVMERMEPCIKRASWPTDFDTNPKVFIEGKTGFAKTKIEKVRDNTDRVLAVLEDTANTLDGILDEIERLVKCIEA